jgi:hypothetical protein
MVGHEHSLIDLLEQALAGDHAVLSSLHSQVAATVFDPTRPAGWLHLAVPVVRRLSAHEPREDMNDEEGLEVALRLARQIWRAGPPFGWNLKVVAAIERMLEKMPSERAAWQRCMDTLAHIGTPEALRAWTERVVQRSGVHGDLWSLIWLAAPGSDSHSGPMVLHHPHAVFPRLLDAMREKELWPLIVRLANASRELEIHPMSGHVDQLVEMLRGGMEGRTTLGGHAPALIAVEAMGALDDERTLEMLHEAAQSDWPELQVAAVVGLGKRGDPDARQNLILLTRWPATHVPAVMAIRDMGEQELAEKCASDVDLGFRSKIGTWAARIRFGGRFPDVVETVHSEWMSWPGSSIPVPVMVGRFSAEDPQHLLMDGAGHLVSVNGRLVGPDFGISHSLPIPEILGLACGIELRNRGRLTEERISWSAERNQVERIWTDELELGSIEPRFGVRIPTSLAYPRSGRGLLFLNEMDRVVISRARRGDLPGWVVREGPFLSWYSQASWPRRTNAEEVIWAHIGRRLLYLDEGVRPPAAEIDPRGPSDEVLLEALEHTEPTERGAPEGWGSLERCLGMATVLGRIACAQAVRGDYPSEVEALVELVRPVRTMLEHPEQCGELLWVDRFVECSLGLVAHGIKVIEGPEETEVFLGHAAEAWKSTDCTAGVLEASLSVGCETIARAMVERLEERDDGWQWPERVAPVLVRRAKEGDLDGVDAYIRTQLGAMKGLERLSLEDRPMDFEPLSTLLDAEQAWQGWWELHQEIYGDKRPLSPDFPRSVLAKS